MLAANSWANTLNSDFKTLLAKYGVGALSEQSFCYVNSSDEIAGHQVSKAMPIASVTKLFTTYFSVKMLDLNQTYTTNFYISGKHLHIEGGRDPYFEKEKMLLLIKSLNDLGFEQFDKVTFDSNFRFSDVSLGRHQRLTNDHTKEKILKYFNTGKNRTFIDSKWNETVKFAGEENVDLPSNVKLKMSVQEVSLKEKSSIFKRFSHYSFKHESRPLHSTIKSMNVLSNNLVAQYLFEESSKKMNFVDFLKREGISTAGLAFYNGSGLPTYIENIRKDNLASCSTVISLLDKLKKAVEEKKFALEELVAVSGGLDLGSFRERFIKFPEAQQSVWAKTGTLNVSSTLAGLINTTTGTIPFAILNKTSKTSAAREFQDNFVSRLFHHLGNSNIIPYEKISIFPLEDKPFLEQVESF